MMLHDMKEHWLQIAQSMVDMKTGPAAAVATVSGVTAVTVPAASTFTMNDISVMAAIFAASATGFVMVLNAILKILEIRRELKKDDSKD